MRQAHGYTPPRACSRPTLEAQTARALQRVVVSRARGVVAPLGRYAAGVRLATFFCPHSACAFRMLQICNIRNAQAERPKMHAKTKRRKKVGSGRSSIYRGERKAARKERKSEER